MFDRESNTNKYVPNYRNLELHQKMLQLFSLHTAYGLKVMFFSPVANNFLATRCLFNSCVVHRITYVLFTFVGFMITG